MRQIALRVVLLTALLAPLTAQGDEAELSGFIIDHTVTRSGQEFHRRFAERINEMGDLDFNLVIKERPSARWGILIWVEMDNQQMYRRFLQPNVADMQEIGYAAADSVLQEIQRRQIEALFQDPIDIGRDEI